jgi:hypothetical protein
VAAWIDDGRSIAHLSIADDRVAGGGLAAIAPARIVIASDDDEFHFYDKMY